MYRKARPFALAVLALAVAAGCHAGDGATSTARPASAPAASGSPARTGTSADADTAFCALARAKGAANLNVFDGDSTTPEQERQVLANIDDLTTAAPAVIHPDFVRFDAFEHALLAENGTPDPALSQEAGGQELRDSLQNISDYLGQHCGIHA
ncbi:hypothetical protein FraEuI1c_3544 [Pseudofrankia inefficax]|uniref:Lipoprotein n=2 Tax=Pseudofrankia inefficax (strain DSM 45817 / CECT 9037 / DDB 130130 / EuI1c) TaxID=298654 RepID=E3IZC4_PSEI1|nr:hypothetical protein FraEuI1c_3544 [Pseudofrankia inefficax]